MCIICHKTCCMSVVLLFFDVHLLLLELRVRMKLKLYCAFLIFYDLFKHVTPGKKFLSLESCGNNSMNLNLEVFVKILRLIIICVSFSTFNNRIFAKLFFSIKSLM